VVLLAVAAASAGCGTRRPDFNSGAAQQEIANALDRKPREIAVYGEERGDAAEEWIVEFQPEGIPQTMEARFLGLDDRWQLVSMRMRARGRTSAEWEDVGVVLGRLRRENVDKAAATIEIMRELAGHIDRYSVEHENKFPAASASGLEELIVGSGYVQSGQWKLGSDGWGNSFTYHAAPDGLSYILVSPGSDSQLDVPEEDYFANTDSGNEAYAGVTKDAKQDFIVASGSFVQQYEP
jgi:hypothetical protein